MNNLLEVSQTTLQDLSEEKGLLQSPPVLPSIPFKELVKRLEAAEKVCVIVDIVHRLTSEHPYWTPLGRALSLWKEKADINQNAL